MLGRGLVAAARAVVVGAVALGGLVLVEHGLVDHRGVELVVGLAGVVVVSDLGAVQLDDPPHRRGVLGGGHELELDDVLALLRGAEGGLVGDDPGVEGGLELHECLVAVVAVVVPAVDEDGDGLLSGLGGLDLAEGGDFLLGAGGRGEREGSGAEEGEGDASACGTSHDEPHFLLEGIVWTD